MLQGDRDVSAIHYSMWDDANGWKVSGGLKWVAEGIAKTVQGCSTQWVRKGLTKGDPSAANRQEKTSSDNGRTVLYVNVVQIVGERAVEGFKGNRKGSKVVNELQLQNFFEKKSKRKKRNALAASLGSTCRSHCHCCLS